MQAFWNETCHAAINSFVPISSHSEIFCSAILDFGKKPQFSRFVEGNQAASGTAPGAWAFYFLATGEMRFCVDCLQKDTGVVNA